MSRKSVTPSAPAVVSSVKFMSAMTRSMLSRASAANPSCGVEALNVRISCNLNRSARADATEGLSSMTSTVRITVMLPAARRQSRCNGGGAKRRPQGRSLPQQEHEHTADDYIAGSEALQLEARGDPQAQPQGGAGSERHPPGGDEQVL